MASLTSWTTRDGIWASWSVRPDLWGPGVDVWTVGGWWHWLAYTGQPWNARTTALDAELSGLDPGAVEAAMAAGLVHMTEVYLGAEWHQEAAGDGGSV